MDKIDIIIKKEGIAMQMIYARGSQSTNFSSTRALYVNNCGFYRNLDEDISVYRENGRNDYHLLISSSGSIKINGREIKQDCAYLFFPASLHDYVYNRGEGSEYFWLHFSGKQLPELIDRYGITEGEIDLGKAQKEAGRIIKMMISALADKYENGDEYCEALLCALLALISAPPKASGSPFARAMKMLEDSQCDKTVTEIAEIYGMTPNHFIRSFKSYVGMSPNSYRIRRRIDNACEMLVSTEMRIESIARAVGYDDPLYFSRAFKSTIGVSPTEYRVQNKLIPDSI